MAEFNEEQFQSEIRQTEWFKEFETEHGEPPNLDDPDYDYRTAWSAGVRPERYEHDGGKYHWPSSLPDGQELKGKNHPTKWMETFMQKTGKDPNELGIKSEAEGDQYIQRLPKGKEPLVDRITRPLPTNIRAYVRGMVGEESPINESFFTEPELNELRTAAQRGIADYLKPMAPDSPSKKWDMNQPITEEMFKEVRAHREKYPDDQYRTYKNEHIDYYHYDDPWIYNRPENIIGWIRNPSIVAQTTVGSARIEREKDDIILTDRYDFDAGRMVGSDLWAALHRAGEKKLPEGKGYDVRINLGNPKDWKPAGDRIFSYVPSKVDRNRRLPERFVNESKLYDELERDEGFRSNVYKDTEGFDTIGFGHKVRPGEDWSKGITREEARKLLEKDSAEARKGAESLPYWSKLNDPQQRAVTNMVFNLGLEGFKGFKKTNKLLEAGKYEEASKEMLNSKWATQVGGRADRLSEMVASR